jgi:SAM-dependent methyltransferase
MAFKYNSVSCIGKGKHSMKVLLQRIVEMFPLSLYLYQGLRNLPRYPAFIKEFLSFKKACEAGRFEIRWKDLYPCLGDKTAATSFDRHYVFHTAWAARIIARTLPEEHVDISSSIYFVALVSAFVNIKFYDYRPADLKLSGLQSEAADLMALPFPDMSVSSLSCMHVVEHIGLGRYGDPLDYNGDLKAICELKRVLAKGGNLLFVVPVGGKPKVMFNAHRIYSYDQVISYFEELELVDFALILEGNKNDGLIEHALKEMADAQTYGCGCFWFRKDIK